MMHKTCPINYGHLADLQKALPTIDLNKKTFHLIKYLLATFIFVLSFQSVLVIVWHATINVTYICVKEGFRTQICFLQNKNPYCSLGELRLGDMIRTRCNVKFWSVELCTARKRRQHIAQCMATHLEPVRAALRRCSCVSHLWPAEGFFYRSVPRRTFTFAPPAYLLMATVSRKNKIRTR